MKLFGLDVREQNYGYFGVRKCCNCDAIRDVTYIKLAPVLRLLGLPISLGKARRFLVCTKCGAAFDVPEELWEHYKTYYNQRYSKSKTDELLSILIKIDANIADNTVDYRNKGYDSVLEMIYNSLIGKFGNGKNLEEVISVYFN